MLRSAVRRARRAHQLHARLSVIYFARGDYARKYLIDEPLLAQAGQDNYDPKIERVVKAALLRKDPLSPEQRARLAKERARPVLSTTEAPGGGLVGTHVATENRNKVLKPGQKTKPYGAIRAGIAAQKRGLTEVPKDPEPPPPEMLPGQHGKKTPPRGPDYEGGKSPDLWNREEAGKPTIVTHTYPERIHPHNRPPLNQADVSRKGRDWRDPLAYHEAKVQAHMTPENLIQTRAEHKPGLPDRYLPKLADLEERRSAQAIPDTLAKELRSLRRTTILPIRQMRRRYLGIGKLKPMSEEGKKSLWASSEALPDTEIAPGKLSKYSVRPMVPILPKRGKAREVSPLVIHTAHQKIRDSIAASVEKHQGIADWIKGDIHNRLQTRYKPNEAGARLNKETARRLTNETFGAHRAGLGLEDWEAENLANDTGTTPDWIRAQHKKFSKHIHLTTEGGEARIRRGIDMTILKRIASNPEPPPRFKFPVMKSLGKKIGIGAGIAGLLGAGAYGAYKLKKRRETQFSVPRGAFQNLQGKLKGLRIGKVGKHELIVGSALTGGITAADAVTSAVYPEPGKTRKQAAWSGAKRGAIYGAVLSGVEPLIRMPLDKRLHLHSSKMKTIQLESGDIPSPWNPKKRLTVVQDRYRKSVREEEINRKESNLAKSAAAGAAVGGLLRHKVGLKLTPSLVAGAAGGLGLGTAALLHGRTTRDPYGEESIASKRIERGVYQAGGVTAAALAAHKLYKAGRRSKLFSSRLKEIRFQQFVKAPDDTPWHIKEARRWIKHPQSRVENAAKWVGRASRTAEDLSLPRNKRTGEVIDERGRTRKAEWQKPYFQRTLYTGAVVGGLTALGLAGRKIYKTSETAGNILKIGSEKGIKIGMGDLTQGERLSLNITSGNWHRALRKTLRGKFPKMASGLDRMSNLRGEFKQAKESIYGTINKGIEKKVGALGGAKTQYYPVGHELEGQVKGIEIINPAKADEDLANIAKREKVMKRAAESLVNKRKKVIKSQVARGRLEEIIKPPEEKFSAQLKEIRFEDEAGYVKVKPHYRQPRSQQPRTQRKKFREGVLAGGIVGAAGLGTAGGFIYHSTRQGVKEKAAEEAVKRVEEILAKRAAGPISHLRVLSTQLDDLIEFKELSKAETKRRKSEIGSSRSKTADAAAVGSVGAGIGGAIGAATGYREPPKKSSGDLPKPKWYDPFKKFRPGAEESREVVADYGNTLGADFPGDEWKHRAATSSSEAFGKGRFTSGEAEARRSLQKSFGRNKRMVKGGAIGAAIGGAALAAPFLLKKPYPSGGGNESAGKKQGKLLGGQIGAISGLLAGATTRHPGGLIGGVIAGSVAGGALGGRVGGAIGSRRKRKGRFAAPTTRELSALLDDIISFN